MDKSKKESILLKAITTQAHYYGELVTVIDKALDGYFDELDELMIAPDSIHLKSIVPELEEVRSVLADLFEVVQELKDIGDSQVERLGRLLPKVL